MILVDSPRARGRALAVLAAGLVANLLLPWYDEYHERSVFGPQLPEGVVLAVEPGYRPVHGWEMPASMIAIVLALAIAVAVLARASTKERIRLANRMRRCVLALAAAHLAIVLAILLDEAALPRVGTAVAFALSIGVFLATLGTFQEAAAPP